MIEFIYKKTLKGYPLITTPIHYDGIFHVTPNPMFTIGLYVFIGKRFLRQGISIYIPFFVFSFYIHNKKKSWEVFDKNNKQKDEKNNS